MHRDVEPGRSPERLRARAGRSVIAVIGIDRYAEWPRLANAVNDARAAARLFTGLGFEQMTTPLLDDAATGDAMRHLVTDELAQLSPDDSLVVFFAGHGHTHTADFGDTSVKTGCVVPVDGARPRGHISASWLRLDVWLSDIARLPPRHILVLVDACHSGVALGALHKWRDEGPEPATELAALQARRSRRVITSALDDQRAMDGGPYPGHSLFTGCLLEAFSGGLAEGGRRVATGRELGLYLQKRVRSYPPSTQTPDFGTFELDDRGDIVVPALADSSVVDPTAAVRAAEPAAATEFAISAGEAMTGPRWRARIGVRVAIGVAAATLVAVLALVVIHREDGTQSSTALAPPDRGSGGTRAAGAAPAESAVATDVRMPDALDAALEAASSPTDATVAPVDAAPVDAMLAAPPRPSAHPPLNTPVVTSPRDRRRTPGDTTKQPPEPRTIPAPPAPDAPPPNEPADTASLASKCSKAAFAAVYEAPSPAPSVVHAALRNLRVCRDAGAISDADFDRYQTALVNKL
jgi:uncharacterized caspase-like protein